MSIRTRHPRLRPLTVAAGLLLVVGTAAGLSACNGGAQTEYPERTSSGTPVAPNDEVTPLPEDTATPSDTPTPVPTTVDDSGTQDGGSD